MSAERPPPPSAEREVSACYRHPKVAAPISCNLCQRPICTSCMVSAPVGWQCPSCVKGGPAVLSMRNVGAGGALAGARPYLTYGIIATCVVMYFAQQAQGVEDDFVVVAAGVAQGEWWRVVTAGFLHGGPIHLVFNMLILFQLGTAFEARLGRARYAALYLLSLIGGSIGAMLLQHPYQAALGASGAVFGLMGASVVLPRRGRSPIEASVGGLLLLNLAITFVIPNISIGGHLGGLAAGALGGLVIRGVGDRVDVRKVTLTTVILATMAAGLFLTAKPVADWRCESETAVLPEAFTPRDLSDPDVQRVLEQFRRQLDEAGGLCRVSGP